MKRWILLLLMATTVAAQQPTNVATDEATHNALRQLKTEMETALNNRDLDEIVANVDPNVVFTTMNGDVCRGPEQIRAYFHKMLEGPGHIVKNVKVSFEVDQLTTLYGGDTGVAYGSSKDHYELTNGSTFDISGRWTCTMVKNGDRWVIAAFHYSANVFDNPVLDRMKKLMMLGIAAAAVLALLIGIGIGRLTKRRA